MRQFHMNYTSSPSSAMLSTFANKRQVLMSILVAIALAILVQVAIQSAQVHAPALLGACNILPAERTGCIARIANFILSAAHSANALYFRHNQAAVAPNTV